MLTAIVTGGSSGFGAGISKKLGSQNIAVVIADIADEQGRVIADQIIEAGGQAIVVQTDVTSRQSWDAAVQLAVQTYGGVNFIINNAGGTYQSKPVHETTEADFDKCIDLNLRSIFHSVHSGFPALQAARKAGQPAAVINIASTGGVRGRPGLTWYSASKAAAISVTQSLAQEFAAEQIRVNCICPVLGNTPMMSSFVGEASSAEYLKSIPLGRFAEPSDIANAASWLCSEESNFITGVVLPVDGGRLA